MRTLWSWMRGHPVVASALVVVTITLGVHLLANWLADRRWARYSEAARARGVKLTLAEIAPPQVPAETNFASLPMWQGIFAGTAPRPLELPRASGPPPTFGNPLKGEPMDWAGWQKLFLDAKYLPATTDSPARDVLRGTEHYAPFLAQWREWRTRPQWRSPVDYQAGLAMPMPHLGTFMDAAKLFRLRMSAHLALGDSAAAYAEFRDGLRAYLILKEEPLFIGGLVQLSVLALLCNGVGDGLKAQQWAEPELRQIAAHFALVDTWHDRQRALSSERGFFNSMYDGLAADTPTGRSRQLGGLMGFMGGGPPAGTPLIMLIPRRVFRDNQLRQNQYLDETLAQVNADGFHPARPTPSGPENIQGLTAPYYYFLFRMSAPSYLGVLQRYITVRAKVDQTRLAIALERHRRARGSFPETLAELAPDWIPTLPHDPANREPYLYRRSAGGETYLLYSRGKNQLDDGGTVDPRKNETNQKDDVWLYAPAEP